MTNIKLIALDLDDTLLREDLTISHYSRSVIKQLEKRGVTVVLASGRSPQALQKYAHFLEMNKRPGYLICNNGTTVTESHTGNIVYQVLLPLEPALKVYDLVDAEGLPIQIYEDDVIFVSRRNEYADQDVKLTGLRQVVVQNFRSLLAQGATKMVIPGDPMLLKPLEIILKTYLGDEVTIFTSKPYFLEILPPHSGKGEALAIVAQRMGLSPHEVMAFGDSMNDESMLRWATYGVAMKNSQPAILELAPYVTEFTNEEDGVARFLEKHLLRKEPLLPSISQKSRGSIMTADGQISSSRHPQHSSQEDSPHAG
ncbi:MAG: Cof-type HAD-IIB family hydrolase [Treponemataceae bacterium]|nr:Cof-type HAD-IIB family hydrolase [Treponemataceae bacterium]